MKHIIYDPLATTQPLAILVKAAAFHAREIENTYTRNLETKGISRDEIIVVALEYNDKGKAPNAFIKEYLEELMPALDSVGTEFIYCADAAYFKVLTGSIKAEPHLGYILQCKIPGYEHMQVVLGVNHKSLIYNPANEPKLTLSLDTLVEAIAGTYQGLGSNVIQNAHYPESVEAIAAALANLHQYPVLAADSETFSLRFNEAGVGTMSFAWSKHEGIAFACDYKPLAEPEGNLFGEFVINPEVRALLREFFETYQGTLRWHNANFDLKILIYALWMENLLDTAGLLKGLETMTARFDCTKIISYLATNTTAGNELGLKDQAHLFAGNWAQDEIKDIRKIPLDKLLQYNLVDSLATNYVFEKRYPEMVADQQLELYRTLMLPSVKTILQIELTGMPLCPVEVAKARVKLQGIMDEHLAVFTRSQTVDTFTNRLQLEEMVKANAKLKKKQHPLSHFASVTFNPNSGPQLQKLLYEEMELPVIDRTKTKLPATGTDTLEALVNHTDNPEYIEILEALVGYSQAAKILSTFIPAFERALDKGDGVIWLHGNFNLGGTVSGRLSSSDPNLQNLPAGSVYGELIKGCFRAPPGWIFCGADFASLEDRINALLTKDPNKLKVYTDGYDGHCLRTFYYWPDQFPGMQETPDEINSIAKSHKDLRGDSKAPTFALTYQGTWGTLVRNSGFTVDEAKAIEANYHQLYVVSTQWVKDRIAQAGRDGYATAAFGLRIRTPLLHQTVLGHRTTPREAESEGRTLGNAISGQSYGLLTNRAMNALMEKVWVSRFRYDILPVAMIHDANYFVVRDNVEAVAWLNRELIAEMRWQELPEIQHPDVKLGAELDLYWPSWASALTLPNDISEEEIHALGQEFLAALQTEKEESAAHEHEPEAVENA